MTVRLLHHSDIPKLQAFYRQQGFDYEFPDLNSPLIEAAHIIADENDEPLCAVIAERMVQLYFIAGDFGPPHARAHALRLLHASVSSDLRTKGYSEATGFLSRPVASRFSKWLGKRFSWTKNSESWSVRF